MKARRTWSLGCVWVLVAMALLAATAAQAQPAPRFILANAREPVRQIISAGKAGERVPVKSVFTPAFVDAITGQGDMNGDGYITGAELGLHLQPLAPEYAEQTPKYGTDLKRDLSRGDFVLPTGSGPKFGAAKLASTRGQKQPGSEVSPVKQVGCYAGLAHEETCRDSLGDGSKGPAMVAIAGDTFWMGSPATEPSRFDDESRHKVTVLGFFMGKHEVTFEEYDAFCDATKREKALDGWGRGKQPVINVSWHDATAYAKWLSRETGKPYRLPSEAEWEYAARAGTTGAYSFDGNIDKYRVNYFDQVGKTLAVGTLPANPWGLHEVHGNVWEWVEDTYSSYQGAPTDGSARVDESSNGGRRVLRGGGWYSDAASARSAYRSHGEPCNRILNFGFRLARGQ